MNRIRRGDGGRCIILMAFGRPTFIVKLGQTWASGSRPVATLRVVQRVLGRRIRRQRHSSANRIRVPAQLHCEITEGRAGQSSGSRSNENRYGGLDQGSHSTAARRWPVTENSGL